MMQRHAQPFLLSLSPLPFLAFLSHPPFQGTLAYLFRLPPPVAQSFLSFPLTFTPYLYPFSSPIPYNSLRPFYSYTTQPPSSQRKPCPYPLALVSVVLAFHPPSYPLSTTPHTLHPVYALAAL